MSEPLRVRAGVVRVVDHADTLTVISPRGTTRVFSGDSADFVRAVLDIHASAVPRTALVAELASRAGADVPASLVDQVLGYLVEDGVSPLSKRSLTTRSTRACGTATRPYLPPDAASRERPWATSRPEQLPRHGADTPGGARGRAAAGLASAGLGARDDGGMRRSLADAAPRVRSDPDCAHDVVTQPGAPVRARAPCGVTKERM